jgi:hypothetical protein
VVAVHRETMELPRDGAKAREGAGDELRVGGLAAERLGAPRQMHHQLVGEEREVGRRVLCEPRRPAPLEESTRFLRRDGH